MKQKNRSFSPPTGGPCIKTPCLFNLDEDVRPLPIMFVACHLQSTVRMSNAINCIVCFTAQPNEDKDLAQSMPALVSELVDALHTAGQTGYPPVPGSDGTPTGAAECDMVRRTGSWQPWV